MRILCFKISKAIELVKKAIIRNAIILSIACSIIFVVSVTRVNAATINAASVSYDDVASAVSRATYGDTVVVPAGTVTWKSTLTITKGITLKGAGIDQTTINFGGSNAVIQYKADPYSRSNNISIRITGFTIDANWLGKNIALTANSLSEFVGSVITNNRIDNNNFAVSHVGWDFIIINHSKCTNLYLLIIFFI